MFLELVITSQSHFQLPHPLRGEGMSLHFPLVHQTVCLTADPHPQSGVGKASLVNRVFRLEKSVREPWPHFACC